MTQYNDIKETDKAYFAGLFDGEGSVSVKKGLSENTIHYSLTVEFGITYASVLYEMKKLFGGNVYPRNHEKYINTPSALKRTDTNPEKWKRKYDYVIKGKEAWIYLKMIEPYSREKMEQIRTAIEFYNGFRDSRGHKRSKSQTDRCEYYHKKLMEMKKSEAESEIFVDNQTKIDLFGEK